MQGTPHVDHLQNGSPRMSTGWVPQVVLQWCSKRRISREVSTKRESQGSSPRSRTRRGVRKHGPNIRVHHGCSQKKGPIREVHQGGSSRVNPTGRSQIGAFSAVQNR
jgi:hypothetical protein